MRLGLTNTIAARGTPVGGDGLALDLQFAEDKTLTARRGPTPVLTRATTATFVGSDGLIQSAAINAARFDHDPVTLASRGLLIEEGRTNTCLQSENFGTTWTNDAGLVAISVDQTTSPSGAMDADKISENTTTSNRRICIQAQTFVNGTTYTFSCFVKAAERDFVQLRFGSTFGGPFQNFIVGGVNAGTIGSGTGATAAIQAYPNGWYRCSITATSATTGSSQVTMGPQVSSTATAWQPYVGTLGSGIFVWGAQLEAGSFATSYIPTTTSALARSADVCSITGANFTNLWNALEGSLFTSAIFNAPLAPGAAQFLVDINDTTAANRLRYYRLLTTGRPEFANTSGNSLNAQIIGSTALQPFVTQKYSAGFKLDDYALYVNNAQIGTDNLGALLISPTTMTIGDASAGATRQYTNGTISAIRYYRKRLANSKLASLTV